jgi:hypothetical protein
MAFILLVFFVSCSKDNKKIQILTENTWIVQEIKQHADSSWEDSFHYWTTLSFLEKDRYIFQSQSDCFIGRVKIKKNEIEFERAYWSPTSRFASKCCYLLSQCKYYEIDADNYMPTLTLTGDEGEIITLIRQKF